MSGWDDVRCPNDGEMTNRRCWKCGWTRPAADGTANGLGAIVAWLRERLADDERIALAAIADDSGQDGGFEDAHWLDDNPWPGQYSFGKDAAAMIRHVAVPRRILAKVAAERRILDAWDRLARPLPPDASSSAVTLVTSRLAAYDDVIRLLVQARAGEPGWREEWALPAE